MSYTLAEKETVITCDDETNKWSVYTLQQKIITKFKKLGIEPTYVDVDGAHHYKGLKFNQVSFRSGKAREMSDEQRQAASDRLKRARENK